MDKRDIKRTDLKTTFLKQMIIRLDYDYLFEEEIEKVVKEVYVYLRQKGYRMNSETMAEFDISLNVANMKENINSTIIDNINVAKDNRENFSSFINEEAGIKIEITRAFTTMNFGYRNFKAFEDLVSDFTKVIEPIKNIREKFELKRIGLRKINYYILNNANKMGDYFESNIIDFNRQIISDLNKIIGKNSIESFLVDNYKVNQNINVSNGVLTTVNNIESNVYQVVLDLDVYDDNNPISIDLLDMNDKLFEIYKSALKISFLSELTKEKFVDDGIVMI